MNGTVALFLVCAGLGQCLLPRRFVALPVLMAFAWLPRAQVLEIGDLKVTIFRAMIAIALLRTIARREKALSGFVSMDFVWVLWSVSMMGTWTLHASADLMFRAGLVWDYFGSYLLLRVGLSSHQDVERLFVAFCAVLLPVGVLMLVEHYGGANPWAVLGGLPTQWREGNHRAAGPFSHPILAGTVGATSLLMGVSLWGRSRWVAGLVGIAGGTAIVHASASSGPILMTTFGLLGLALWRYRARLTVIRWAAVVLLLLLQMAMRDPVYFLMAKIDVVGGSTGWHRARLIQSAVEHFGEWWLAGTDRTIHWMSTGILANDQHTDLTNHYLAMGVLGGLPLLIPFVLAIGLLMRRVDRAVSAGVGGDDRLAFLAWAVGALMFAHAINFFSASLFDQSIASFMLLFACAGAFGQERPAATPEVERCPPQRLAIHERARPSFR